jgi:hypothetical protein
VYEYGDGREVSERAAPHKPGVINLAATAVSLLPPRSFPPSFSHPPTSSPSPTHPPTHPNPPTPSPTHTHPPTHPHPILPPQKKVGRAYARVSRRLLRAHLLDMCKAAGVTYLAAEVTDTAVAPDGRTVEVACSNGATCSSR